MSGKVGAMFNGALQFGSAIGLVAITSMETSVEATHGVSVSAYRDSFESAGSAGTFGPGQPRFAVSPIEVDWSSTIQMATNRQLAGRLDRLELTLGEVQSSIEALQTSHNIHGVKLLAQGNSLGSQTRGTSDDLEAIRNDLHAMEKRLTDKLDELSASNKTFFDRILDAIFKR
ncbi:hypothetical protein EDB19DRAFT_1910045 [Suillus lakei]|nr:hypothetical protein EDB19DRAFT_1910045 [Suillus lakei]